MGAALSPCQRKADRVLGVSIAPSPVEAAVEGGVPTEGLFGRGRGGQVGLRENE